MFPSVDTFRMSVLTGCFISLGLGNVAVGRISGVAVLKG